MPLPTAAALLLFAAQRRRLGDGRACSWLLLAAIAVVLLLINVINVGISYVARAVENALVQQQGALFWRIVVLYGFCLVLALPRRTLQVYLVPRLALVWRRWLSVLMLTDYLADPSCYRLDSEREPDAPAIDNPDQRIAQDVNSFTGSSLSVILEMLWSISGRLAITLLHYAGGGTAVVLIASRQLVRLNSRQLRLEADFRYGLVHIRDNAEAIAFSCGERQEQRQAQGRLAAVIANAEYLIRWEALIAPISFAKQVDFGVFGQASIAFSQVLFSVSYIVNTIDRLAAFAAPVAAPPGGAQAGPESILVRNADVVPPRGGRLLIRDLSVEVSPGQ
ncbi:MAG: ABC transporter ATP-binding protein/permease, partial [Synechococcaceae cyanobacterium]|nr:ABC transporter ATP-binding protein/permease [Synechococcaceae cyanobacterium]